MVKSLHCLNPNGTPEDAPAIHLSGRIIFLDAAIASMKKA